MILLVPNKSDKHRTSDLQLLSVITKYRDKTIPPIIIIIFLFKYRMPKQSDLDLSVIELDEPKIATGFDRGVDFEPMKAVLQGSLDKHIIDLDRSKKDGKPGKIKINRHKILYCVIAMVQLVNGSRISEACYATAYFCKHKKYKDLCVVKIAKSESIKYRDGEKIKTKPRFRKMKFPLDWIVDKEVVIKCIEDVMTTIPYERLKKRVLDYLLIYHKCNTHSLRYACINYLIYEKGRPLNDVAKFVGHIDLSMLTKYTQQKNCEKIFELGI